MLKIVLHMRKLNILSAMAYRTSFIIQIVSMILNDMVILVVFYFFFDKFGTIWGMDFQWYLRLLLIIVRVYSIIHVLFFGSRKLGDTIMNGWLDSHLLLPKNILIRILVSGFSVSALGDAIYGVWLLFFIKNLTIIFVIKAIFVSICWGIIFTGFMVIFESLAFRIWSSKELSRSMLEAVLGPSHYPPDIFKGMAFKVLFMTIFPVFFIAYLPYEILSFEFNIRKILLLLWATVFFAWLGAFVFYKWLHKYESGNLMNVNL